MGRSGSRNAALVASMRGFGAGCASHFGMRVGLRGGEGEFPYPPVYVSQWNHHRRSGELESDGLVEIREPGRVHARAGGTRRVQLPRAVYGLSCGLGGIPRFGPVAPIQIRGRRASVFRRYAFPTPPYPLLAGAPEERRALAAYLETLIAESGRTLAPRLDPPRAETKPSVRPAVVSKTSTEGAEKRSENSEANTPEVVEKGAAAPVFSPPDAAQVPERAQEAKKSEKEDRPVGSPAPPNDAQDGARALDAGKPEEREDVSPVPPGPPAEKQDAISVPEAKIPPEKESTTASATRLNDAPGNNVEKSTGSAGAEDKGVASKASLLPPTDESGAGKSQDVDMPENYGQGGAAPPAPLSGAPDAENPADGESVPAAPSAPPNDSQDAKLPEEKNSP